MGGFKILASFGNHTVDENSSSLATTSGQQIYAIGGILRISLWPTPQETNGILDMLSKTFRHVFCGLLPTYHALTIYLSENFLVCGRIVSVKRDLRSDC